MLSTIITFFILVFSVEASASIVLENKNTISIDDNITKEFMSEKIVELFKMSHALKKTDDIYLVIDTYGGNVIAANAFIEAMRAIPQKVHSVVVKAMSAGFGISQLVTGSRYTMDHSVYMDHKGMLSVGGDDIETINAKIKYLNQQRDVMLEGIARRLGLTLQEYIDLIAEDWYVAGGSAVELKVADKKELFMCGKTLLKEVVVTRGFRAVSENICPLKSP
jgi:ATP-dependent protease ClpP protease subunit